MPGRRKRRNARSCNIALGRCDVYYLTTPYRYPLLPQYPGAANPLPTPPRALPPLGKADQTKQAAYRSLFRADLANDASTDCRWALRQNQPLGNARLDAPIDAMTGPRRMSRTVKKHLFFSHGAFTLCC